MGKRDRRPFVKETFSYRTGAPQFQLNRPNERKRKTRRALIGIGAFLVCVVVVFFIAKSSFIASLGFRFSAIKLPSFSLQSRVSRPEVVPEQPFEDRLREALKTVITLESIQKIDAYSVQVVSTDTMIVLFNRNKDLTVQVSSLQTILAQSRIEKRQLRKVDLRFSKIALE